MYGLDDIFLENLLSVFDFFSLSLYLASRFFNLDILISFELKRLSDSSTNLLLREVVLDFFVLSL